MDTLKEYLIQEFVADYKDGLMSRRDMVRRVLYITGGVASTAAILSAMGCGPSQTSPTTGPVPGSSEKTVPAAGASASPIPNTSAAASPSPSAAAVPSPAGAPSPAAAASPSPSPAVARSPLSVPANDPSIDTSTVSFPNGDAMIQAYQAAPKTGGPFPLMLICHQNTGLNEHIRDVARRYAKAGYLAAAVDLLSRNGGTDRIADPAQIPGLLSNASPDQMVGDFGAALKYYANQPMVKSGLYGMTGFCFGGGIVWRATEALADLKAASPWYGPPPPIDKVGEIKAAIYAVYSSDPQDFANNNRDQLFQALKDANKTADFKAYPGTVHAFNDDTTPRYNQEQALAAWQDTQAFFTKYLKS